MKTITIPGYTATRIPLQTGHCWDVNDGQASIDTFDAARGTTLPTSWNASVDDGEGYRDLGGAWATEHDAVKAALRDLAGVTD